MFEQMRKEKIAHIEEVLTKYLPKEANSSLREMPLMLSSIVLRC